MKRIKLSALVLLGFSSFVSAQNANPYISISAVNSGLVPNGSNTIMEVLTGNFADDPICPNSLEVTISVGLNVEIMGIGVGSDPRWTLYYLSSGAGNTIKFRNTAGGFNDYDVTYVYLDIKGVALGGPNNCAGNISYIPEFNPCANGGVGAQNVWQGNGATGDDNSPTSFTVTIPLPLHFTSFISNSKDCGARLTWSTAQEENVKSFEVQQSFDGNNYTTVGTLLSKGTGANDYSFETNQPQKAMYYRVVAIDMDGRRTYSSTNKVQLSNCQKASMVKVYPIPAFRSQEITILTNVPEKTDYRLFDMSGKLVKSGAFLKTTQFKVATGGTYMLEVSGKDYKESQKIIVQ